MHDDATRDHGLQPLDTLVSRWGLTNHGLVEISVEQLNHKQVQRARHGRQLTLSMMQKVARALNEAILTRLPKDEQPKFSRYAHKHLFNYAKGHDANWTDPNAPLMSAPVEADGRVSGSVISPGVPIPPSQPTSSPAPPSSGP